nr:Chain B, Epidermal growth factor receptor substrate 15 [Homo sapiens]
YDPFKGSDPFA